MVRPSSRRRSGSQKPIGNCARRSRGRRPHATRPPRLRSIRPPIVLRSSRATRAGRLRAGRWQSTAHRHVGEPCGMEAPIEAGVCARPGRDARTRTSCQLCPQLGPQRQAVPRGYVDSTNQHRHPTPGRTTRASSASLRAASTSSSTVHANAASKRPSGNGTASALPTSKAITSPSSWCWAMADASRSR